MVITDLFHKLFHKPFKEDIKKNDIENSINVSIEPLWRIKKRKRGRYLNKLSSKSRMYNYLHG